MIIDTSAAHTKWQRKERLKAAADAALQLSKETGQSATELMAEATGENVEVCHGYIVTSPSWFPDAGVDRNAVAAMAAAEAAALAQAEAEGETIVWVRRQWNDSNDAAYRLSDIDGWHWSDVSGGIQAKANRSYLHAYVWCDAMLSGGVAHSCRHGEGPHRIKVCVVKNNNKTAWLKIEQAMENERR